MNNQVLGIKPEALAEVSKDIGQVIFASVFIASIMGEETNLFVSVVGFMFSLIFWSVYALLSNK